MTIVFTSFFCPYRNAPGLSTAVAGISPAMGPSKSEAADAFISAFAAMLKSSN
jgi:hypothetical protein